MPARTMLLNVFRDTFNKSCLKLHAVHKLDNLLSITGPQWFTHQLVKVGVRGRRSGPVLSSHWRVKRAEMESDGI